MNRTPNSIHTQHFINGIINNVISTNDNEMQQYILEWVLNMSNDNVQQLFINTINNNNQIDITINQKLLKLVAKIIESQNKPNVPGLQNTLNNNEKLSCKEILSIFQSTYDIKILVDFMKNYPITDNYIEKIVSNILQFVIAYDIFNENNALYQKFTNYFIANLNNELLLLFTKIINQHMRNIDPDHKVSQERYKNLQYYMNNYQNNKKQYFVVNKQDKPNS